MLKAEKRLVDLFLHHRREYLDSDWDKKKDINQITSGIAKVLEHQTGVDWIAWSDLLWSIIGVDGFMPNATNEDFYRVLNALNVEVVDEVGNCH